MFDPEKVERYEEDYSGLVHDPMGEYVKASDYEQLLALYRTYKQAFEDVMEVEFSSSEKDEDFQSYLKSARDTIAEAGK